MLILHYFCLLPQYHRLTEGRKKRVNCLVLVNTTVSKRKRQNKRIPRELEVGRERSKGSGFGTMLIKGKKDAEG